MNSTVKSTYKFHKYADLYPLASEEELSRLTEDIKKNGLANPIVILDDEYILDGRNRYIACQRAGVKPIFVTWEESAGNFHGQSDIGGDDDDILRWVIAQNSHRRHLSQDQLKMVVAKVAESFKDNANQRRLAALKKGDARPDPVTATVAATGTAIQQAIKATGFKGSERSVADAVKVQKESPELTAKVSAGEITVNAAKKELPKQSKPTPVKKPLKVLPPLPVPKPIPEDIGVPNPKTLEVLNKNRKARERTL